MKKWLVKYNSLLLAILTGILFSGYYYRIQSTDYSKEIDLFQQNFLKTEKQLAVFLNHEISLFTKKENFNTIPKDKNNPFYFHVYENDSLIFWNSNELPISAFAESQFPSEGIVHLKNGWYYSKICTSRSKKFVGTFLIKRDFSYENTFLKNDFSEPFKLRFSAQIEFNGEQKNAIKNNKGAILFALTPFESQPISATDSQWLMCLLLISFSFSLLFLYRLFKQQSIRNQAILLVSLLIIRILSLQFHWVSFLEDAPAFQATLYGTNEWFPNFFDYLITILLLYFVVLLFCGMLYKSTTFFNGKVKQILLVVLLFIAWFFIHYLNKGLVENSSIPLTIDRLFSLNLYSLFAFSSMAILYYSFFLLLIEVLQVLKYHLITQRKLYTVFLTGTIIYAVLDALWGYGLFFDTICLAILFLSSIYYTFKKKSGIQVGFLLVFLFLFSAISAANFASFISQKELSERPIVANKLVNEQEIVTEVEFHQLAPQLKNDQRLSKVIDSPGSIRINEFEKRMERQFFNQFWERYELNFNLFDTTGSSCLEATEWNDKLYKDWNSIIEQHGQVSEIDSTMYFIKDYTQQISYIIRMPLQTEKGNKAWLFVVLKSKKIPEEIGFPRLLLSSNAHVFESLENYSIAKYHNNRLVAKYGRFNYPSTILALKSWEKSSPTLFFHDDYTHFLLKKSQNDQLLLSSKSLSWLTIAKWISYFFAFYGLFLIPFLFRLRAAKSLQKTLTLAVKIQLVLVSLVAITLLIFGWGSGVFIRDQYMDFSNLIVRQKMNSVELEMRSKFADKNQFNLIQDGSQLSYYLQRFAKVFETDINLYDPKGFLLASSRPKVFNAGLISEQINPIAKKALFQATKSEFMHTEKIGELEFTSAYLPFYSTNGKLLGTLNLQHFGQQLDLQNQIQQFLVSIINVFMVLLAISVVLAISLSSWLTAPLRLLQERFSQLQLGKSNQQLYYANEDEIGDLVKEYNLKLKELEQTTQQLAQSERESAWREMAKQVAHEIKNPLTPMKLSAQQLMRSFQADDPKAKEKITRVAQSMIEQIDALTNIANEFAHFAKMPPPKMETIDLIPILENVVEVNRIDSCAFVLNFSMSKALILGDKEQMLRTFNNLIKNAIQAIPSEKQGQIIIRLAQESSKIIVEIEDNGIGIIPEEQAKLFVPYFTTKSNGTGLGLAMVKQIVENHAGMISFHTTPKMGTIFTISLPTI